MRSKTLVVALLGDIATRRDGGDLRRLPGARARSLLVALAADVGRSRSAQALIDDVWGEAPPRAPMNALHTQVSRLRGALPDGAIEISPAGYRLTLDPDQVDLSRARSLAADARRSHDGGAYQAALGSIAEARALWRGEPGAELPAGQLSDELAAAAIGCVTLLDSIEIAVRVALGDYHGALAPARSVADRAPLDEAAHADLMRVLAKAGRANEALEVFADIRTRLADKLGADPGPTLIELNTAVLRGSAGERTEQTPAAAPPIGVRAAPNPLLGRERDLDALDELLRNARVVTVLGPGGTGKTRVANEVGMRCAGRLPVALIELAAVRSGDDVLAAVVSTLGLSEVERVKPTGFGATIIHTPMQRLRETLGGGPTLLILDNCEHVIESVAEVVAELIAACDGLTVLTTSRAPLMIGAESVYPLAPLVIDEHGSPATELFVARSRAVRPSARLDPAEVARLCRTLDGLPLAIELAAARMRTMSVTEINAALDHRFRLLRGGDRTSPERHRTLHSVIDWSWNLLDAPQQAALRRLCRFAGGFTLSAARTVAGWDVAKDIDDALDGLVNQSLLTVIEDVDSGETRYRMLETVKEFGEEQLTLADEHDIIWERMSQWAEDIASRAIGVDGPISEYAMLFEFAGDQDNLVTVLRHAITRRPETAATRRTVFLVFPALVALWWVKGQESEVESWAVRVAELDPPDAADVSVPFNALALSALSITSYAAFAEDFRNAMRGRTRLRRLLRDRSDGTAAVRYQAWVACGPVTGYGMGRILAEGVASDDPMIHIGALFARANVKENNGDIVGSMRDAVRALPAAERRGDSYMTAMICQHIGGLLGQTARYEEAVPYYRRAVDGLRRLGAQDSAAQHNSFLAGALVGANQLAEARRVVESVLAAHTEKPNAALAASIAELTLAEGEIDIGLAEYRRSLELSGWPDSLASPGPFGMLLAGATIGAFVLHGQADQIRDCVEEVIGHAGRRLTQVPDLPQIGAVAVAIGGYRIATGDHSDIALDLIALAPRVRGRQDFPSLEWNRHAVPARAAVGDDRFEAALARASGHSRPVAAAGLLQALSGM